MLLVSALLACGGGEKSVAELDGPVSVKLEKKTRWGGGRLPGPSTHGELVVESSHGTIKVAAECYEPAPDIQGDMTPHRFAYRCDPVAQWRLLYVTPQAVFAHCAPLLGAGTVPSFSKAKADADAALLELGGCASAWAPPEQARLFDYAQSLGEVRLVNLLAGTSDSFAHPIWEQRVAGLSEPGLEALRVHLRRALALAGAERVELCRALALLTDDDPILAQYAEVRLKEFTEFYQNKPLPCSVGLGRLIKTVEKTNPQMASAAACKLLSRGAATGKGRRRLPQAFESAAYAALKPDSCAGLWSRVEQEVCDPDLLCGDELCSAEHVSERIKASSASPNPQLGGSIQERERYAFLSLLRAAYAQGPPPKSLTERLKRLSYDVQQLADCSVRALGESCCETTAVRRAACASGLAGSPSNTACRLVVDDAAKSIVVQAAATTPAPSVAASASGGTSTN